VPVSVALARARCPFMPTAWLVGRDAGVCGGDVAQCKRLPPGSPSAELARILIRGKYDAANHYGT
jgi:hypothetical protein